MKAKHKHKWRWVGSCEVAWSVHYARYRCACGARKLQFHAYGSKPVWIKLKRRDTWEQHEVP